MDKEKVDLYSDNVGFVELVDYMGSDLTVVNSARVSFGKHKSDLDSKDKKLIKYLIKHRHTSTLEHNVVTFRINVPLFVRSQHYRHRTWSYNEVSRRYTDFDIKFYEPKKFRTQHVSNRQASTNDLINPELEVKLGMGDFRGEYYGTASKIIKAWHRDSLKLYDCLLDAGICREQARGVLPQNMYTEYYGTCNMNNLFKFIDLRSHKSAQWEIQQLAEGMLKVINNLWPITVAAYEKNKENS